jgi:hypothetical protein
MRTELALAKKLQKEGLKKSQQEGLTSDETQYVRAIVLTRFNKLRRISGTLYMNVEFDEVFHSVWVAVSERIRTTVMRNRRHFIGTTAYEEVFAAICHILDIRRVKADDGWRYMPRYPTITDVLKDDAFRGTRSHA